MAAARPPAVDTADGLVMNASFPIAGALFDAHDREIAARNAKAAARAAVEAKRAKPDDRKAAAHARKNAARHRREENAAATQALACLLEASRLSVFPDDPFLPFSTAAEKQAVRNAADRVRRARDDVARRESMHAAAAEAQRAEPNAPLALRERTIACEIRLRNAKHILHTATIELHHIHRKQINDYIHAYYKTLCKLLAEFPADDDALDELEAWDNTVRVAAETEIAPPPLAKGALDDGVAIGDVEARFSARNVPKPTTATNPELVDGREAMFSPYQRMFARVLTSTRANVAAWNSYFLEVFPAMMERKFETAPTHTGMKGMYIRLQNIRLIKPMMMHNGRLVPKLPIRCLQDGTTYAARILADVAVFQNPLDEVGAAAGAAAGDETMQPLYTRHNVRLHRIPIVVGCIACHTHGLTAKQRTALGEDPAYRPGAFIIGPAGATYRRYMMPESIAFAETVSTRGRESGGSSVIDNRVTLQSNFGSVVLHMSTTTDDPKIFMVVSPSGLRSSFPSSAQHPAFVIFDAVAQMVAPKEYGYENAAFEGVPEADIPEAVRASIRYAAEAGPGIQRNLGKLSAQIARSAAASAAAAVGAARGRAVAAAVAAAAAPELPVGAPSPPGVKEELDALAEERREKIMKLLYDYILRFVPDDPDTVARVRAFLVASENRYKTFTQPLAEVVNRHTIRTATDIANPSISTAQAGAAVLKRAATAFIENPTHANAVKVRDVDKIVQQECGSSQGSCFNTKVLHIIMQDILANIAPAAVGNQKLLVIARLIASTCLTAIGQRQYTFRDMMKHKRLRPPPDTYHPILHQNTGIGLAPADAAAPLPAGAAAGTAAEQLQRAAEAIARRVSFNDTLEHIEKQFNNKSNAAASGARGSRAAAASQSRDDDNLAAPQLRGGSPLAAATNLDHVRTPLPPRARCTNPRNVDSHSLGITCPYYTPTTSQAGLTKELAVSAFPANRHDEASFLGEFGEWIFNHPTFIADGGAAAGETSDSDGTSDSDSDGTSDSDGRGASGGTGGAPGGSGASGGGSGASGGGSGASGGGSGASGGAGRASGGAGGAFGGAGGASGGAGGASSGSAASGGRRRAAPGCPIILEGVPIGSTSDPDAFLYHRDDENAGRDDGLFWRVKRHMVFRDVTIVQNNKYVPVSDTDSTVHVERAPRNREICIFVSGSRIVRPLLVVGNHDLRVNEIASEARRREALLKWTMERLIQEGMLMLVSAAESATLFIAERPEYVRGELARRRRELARDRNTVHFMMASEIDPVALFGMTVSLVPNASQNYGPRLTFQGNMGAQAKTVPHLFSALRNDNTVKYSSPSRALAETVTTPMVYSRPISRTFVLSVNASALNAEDAIRINPCAFRFTFANKLRVKSIKLNKVRRGGGFGGGMPAEEVRLPQEVREARLAGLDNNLTRMYAAIDDEGWPIVGRFVSEGMAVLSIVSPPGIAGGKEKVRTEFEGVGDGGRIRRFSVSDLFSDRSDRDAAAAAGAGAAGPAQRILVLIEIESVRREEVGNKFATMESQKGTIGACVTDLTAANTGPRMTSQTDTEAALGRLAAEMLRGHRKIEGISGAPLTSAGTLISADDIADDSRAAAGRARGSNSAVAGARANESAPGRSTVASQRALTRAFSHPQPPSREAMQAMLKARATFSFSGAMPTVAGEGGVHADYAGTEPEIEMNTHGLPGRMTAGLVTKSSQMSFALFVGCRRNASAFMAVTDEDVAVMEEVFARWNLPRDWKFSMRNGDGTLVRNPVSAMIVDYQQLVQTVADKVQSRGRGGMNWQSMQPMCGRSLNGGIRAGVQEVLEMVANGAVHFLQERMTDCSDGTTMEICLSCGRPTWIQFDASGQIAEHRRCTFCGKHEIGIVRTRHILRLLVSMLQMIGINIAFTHITDSQDPPRIGV
jgi:DNA-directed RNA polymerase beta subunit